MNNKAYLNQMKNTYASLRYFSIEDNYLILALDRDYKIPISNINLSSLNQNLFILEPSEIFHIIYTLQLLPQSEITQDEEIFIKQYVTRYLKLNDMALTESNLDTNLIWGLSIPIYSSYDPECINNPSCQIIHNMINNHSEEIENNKGKHPRLVLTNPNFESTSNEVELTSFEKAGFTTMLIIWSTVAATCAYIAYFFVH